MKIRIEVPDSLFHEIQSSAELQGTDLESFLIRAAKTEVAKTRALFPMAHSKGTVAVSTSRTPGLLEEEQTEMLSR